MPLCISGAYAHQKLHVQQGCAAELNGKQVNFELQRLITLEKHGSNVSNIHTFDNQSVSGATAEAK